MLGFKAQKKCYTLIPVLSYIKLVKVNTFKSFYTFTDHMCWNIEKTYNSADCWFRNLEGKWMSVFISTWWAGSHSRTKIHSCHPMDQWAQQTTASIFSQFFVASAHKIYTIQSMPLKYHSRIWHLLASNIQVVLTDSSVTYFIKSSLHPEIM
jgi:hypothetical protein